MYKKAQDANTVAVSRNSFLVVLDITHELNLKASDPNIPLKRGYARIERGNKIISKNDKLLKNDKIKIIRYNQENEAIIIDENQK